MHELTPAIFDTEESYEMTEPTPIIKRVVDGLDFGEGAISGRDDQEVLDRTDEVIRSPQILVPVDRDDQGRALQDDGCGDGREAKLIFRLKQFFKRNLNRAKVFGGAAAMGAAGLIGTGQAKGHTLERTFDNSIDTLEAQGVDFGAHTDEHANGENCGCGAIDNAPKIVRAAIKYKREICEVIASLDTDVSELGGVYDNFQAFVNALPADEEYSGRRVMGKIIQAGKVVKQLAGAHHEKSIVLNAVRGHTVDQDLVRRQTHGKAQVFAVDIWRLRDIATGLFPSDKQAATQAYLSQLIYTLATAAVLTKGDLPVYTIQ